MENTVLNAVKVDSGRRMCISVPDSSAWDAAPVLPGMYVRGEVEFSSRYYVQVHILGSRGVSDVAPAFSGGASGAGCDGRMAV